MALSPARQRATEDTSFAEQAKDGLDEAQSTAEAVAASDSMGADSVDPVGGFGATLRGSPLPAEDAAVAEADRTIPAAMEAEAAPSLLSADDLDEQDESIRAVSLEDGDPIAIASDDTVELAGGDPAHIDPAHIDPALDDTIGFADGVADKLGEMGGLDGLGELGVDGPGAGMLGDLAPDDLTSMLDGGFDDPRGMPSFSFGADPRLADGVDDLDHAANVQALGGDPDVDLGDAVNDVKRGMPSQGSSDLDAIQRAIWDQQAGQDPDPADQEVVDKKAKELADATDGDPGDADPGDADPSDADPGDADPGGSDSGGSDSGGSSDGVTDRPPTASPPPPASTPNPETDTGGGVIGQEIPVVPVAEDPLETDVYETLIDPGDPDSGIDTGERVASIDAEAVIDAQLDPYITPHPDDEGDGEDIFGVGDDPMEIDVYDTLVDPPETLDGGALGAPEIAGEDPDMMSDGMEDDGGEAIDDGV